MKMTGGEAGYIFVGIGIMTLFLVMSYFLYQLTRILKSNNDLEEKYYLFEEMVLDKVAKNKGFNLEKEIMRRKLFKEQKPSLRKKLKLEMYEEMFGKWNEETKGTTEVKTKNKGGK